MPQTIPSNAAHLGPRLQQQQQQQQQHNVLHQSHHPPRTPDLLLQQHPSATPVSQPLSLPPSERNPPPLSHAHVHPGLSSHTSFYPSAPPPPAQRHPNDTAYFHPSPYSAQSAAGSYASSEPSDPMAAQTAMGQRPHYPPISSYQTPQSNSPASMNSPQPDSRGRSVYSMPSMTSMQQQPMYYQSQYMQQPGVYGQQQHHTSAHQQQQQPPPQQQQHQQPQPQAQPQPQQQQHRQTPQQQHPQPRHHPHQQMSPVPGMLMSQPVQPSHHQMQHAMPTHHAAQQSPVSAYESKPSPSTMQQQQPHQQQQQQQQQHVQQPMGSAPPHTPASATAPGGPTLPNQSAAPGPIPATTPLVVRQDHNGVQWIAFEYSRDRVKMEYTIRCDVESVNVAELSAEFKNANCVYPRACCSKDQYKGNRLHYETECNSVGWALAQLNPPLREKRGLIQRAVDSWRNSNQDLRLRSRRVRRIAKMNTRKHNGNAANQAPNVAPAVPAHVATAHVGAPQNMQSHTDYGSAPAHHHQVPPINTGFGNQQQPRYAHNFYPTHPQLPLSAGQHSMDGTAMRPTSTAMASSSSAGGGTEADDTERQNTLFGDVPESRKRKFILVDDGQRGTRVRVRVTLDKVKLDDMPDAHLRLNAVYPRSYFPRQTASPSDPVFQDDEDDSRAAADANLSSSAAAGALHEDLGLPLAVGTTVVPVPLLDGSEARSPVPRMTTSRRQRELALNELGCRMAWGQARTFSGRTLFLQRSLDAYRSKQRGAMIAGGRVPSEMPPHFETRPGKRKLNTARGRAPRPT